MNDKLKIDGLVRKIRTTNSEKDFFDFEFWSESDSENYGVVCFCQKSKPNHLFIIKLENDEIAENDKNSFELAKKRIFKKTGVGDLESPTIIRFQEEDNEAKNGFKEFLKNYKKPTPIYKSIFNHDEEAQQTEKLSIGEFKEIGGKLILLGDIEIQEN
ncbi:MAG: hypothetical protein ACRBBR_00620 [Cellvibrionaceae bacterium]